MTANRSHQGARSRPELRLTRRGRALLVLMAVGAVLLSFWLGTWQAGVAATDGGGSGGNTGSYDTVVLRPGDTLWEIAERREPDADPRVTVYRIKELNGLSKASVAAGQRLVLPPRQ